MAHTAREQYRPLTLRRIAPLLLAPIVAAACPSAAMAQEPDASAAARPASTEMTLAVTGIHGRHATAVSGTRLRIEGTVSRFVAGQQVVVGVYRGARRVSSRTVSILPGEDGTGRFRLGQRVRGAGHFVIRASHAATAELDTVHAEATGFDVLPTRLRGGDRGSRVRVVQKHLDELGYVVGRRGSFDARTRRAILALRKVLRMARTTSADRAVMDRLAAGHGRFAVRHRNHGRHVEADLARQVVALIGAGGKVERIYPTSSGARSTPTVTGSFRVYRKQPGTNRLGMVHSVYFIRGYALHGYRSVPTYPASHGCLRLPVPDARSVYDWMRMGTRVDVYRR